MARMDDGCAWRLCGPAWSGVVLGAVVLFGGGCSWGDDSTPVPEGIGKTGALGHGEFTYLCSGRSDAACFVGPKVVPDCLARGATFGLGYRPTEGPSAEVTPMSEAFISELGTAAFETSRVGVAALVAERADEAVDFIDWRIVDAPAFAILASAPDDVYGVDLPAVRGVPTLEVPQGETRDLAIVAVDGSDGSAPTGCSRIGGKLRFGASSSDAGIASVRVADLVAVRGVSVGEAELTVRVPGIDAPAVVRVVVSEALDPGGTSGPGSTSGAGDTAALDTLGTVDSGSGTETQGSSGATSDTTSDVTTTTSVGTAATSSSSTGGSP